MSNASFSFELVEHAFLSRQGEDVVLDFLFGTRSRLRMNIACVDVPALLREEPLVAAYVRGVAASLTWTADRSCLSFVLEDHVIGRNVCTTLAFGSFPFHNAMQILIQDEKKASAQDANPSSD